MHTNSIGYVQSARPSHGRGRRFETSRAHHSKLLKSLAVLANIRNFRTFRQCWKSANTCGTWRNGACNPRGAAPPAWLTMIDAALGERGA